MRYQSNNGNYELCFTAPVDGTYRYNGETFKLLKGESMRCQFKAGEGIYYVAPADSPAVASEHERVQEVGRSSTEQVRGEEGAGAKEPDSESNKAFRDWVHTLFCGEQEDEPDWSAISDEEYAENYSGEDEDIPFF